MNPLLDASSLILLIKKADVHAAVKRLQEAVVLDLTYYEIGNIIWKESRITKFLTTKEAENLGRMVQEILAKVNQINNKSEAFLKTLEIAHKENLSFYDSSYIYSAKEQDLTLITEDKRLKEKAKKYVDVFDVLALLSR
jgi:predicted nucleic acid-binding protein